MNRWIRLYPVAWRARYGDELLALLEERPPTIGDRIDIVRGALDARMHPQVIAADAAEGGPTLAARFAGIAAIAGGTLWALGGIAMNAAPVMRNVGYKDSTAGIITIFAGMVLVGIAGLVTARGVSGTGRAGTGSAIAMLVGAALTPLPWPIMFLGYLTGAIGATVFGVAIYRAIGRPTALLVGAAAIVSLFINTEDGRALLTVPYGVAWALFGLDIALRRPALRPVIAPAAG
jgi:hypothetical protein